MPDAAVTFPATVTVPAPVTEVGVTVTETESVAAETANDTMHNSTRRRDAPVATLTELIVVESRRETIY